MIDTIIDIHHQHNIDFAAVKAAGIVAIIHKAAEGATFQDPKYRERRAIAKKMGFLWGAYHFSSGRKPIDQVKNFLETAEPEDDDLIALDYEGSTSGPDMTLDQAIEFIQLVREKTKRLPVIYGGRLLRQNVAGRTDETLAQCPLWYARYRDEPVGLPTHIWPAYTLWQYTNGKNGLEPKTVTGIGKCDRNKFQGTTVELIAQWPFIEVIDP